MNATIQQLPLVTPLPRVLFCTYEIPQSVNAGSMQLFRVLRDYPPDQLQVLGPEPEPGARTLACRYISRRLLAHRLTCTRFRDWAAGINSLGLLPDIDLRGSVRESQGFRPDVVVTVMDKLSYYRHAWALARRLRAQLVTITMDDPQTFEKAPPILRGAFTRFLRRMYGDAALSIGVSPEMCEYLSTNFGKPSTLFYFGPPDGLRSRPPAESARLKASSHLTLGYAGSMSLGYLEGILALLPALEQSQTRLIIYTKETSRVPNHPLVINRGFVAPEMLWPSLQTECDALILPYSFAQDIAPIYRTHFPTKISEYCWSGMPILIVGPDYATGVHWGLQHAAAAETAISFAPDIVLPSLLKLKTDTTARLEMAAAGPAIAADDFNPSTIRQQFTSLLCQAAGCTKKANRLL
jgi:hypothetical protein